mmetsp:Transcript_23243/g.41361  ORF Transcript_23243/g.41361 Transcript_23243/m.41361 type:complete len:104 (+) Transcript_23243:438-749(+)
MAGERTKSFIVYCKFVEDMETRRAPVREAHIKHFDAHTHLGLMVGGPILKPVDSSLDIWVTNDEEMIRNFVVEDPYYQAGLITEYWVREYMPVVGQLKDSFTR